MADHPGAVALGVGSRAVDVHLDDVSSGANGLPEGRHRVVPGDTGVGAAMTDDLERAGRRRRDLGRSGGHLDIQDREEVGRSRWRQSEE